MHRENIFLTTCTTCQSNSLSVTLCNVSLSLANTRQLDNKKMSITFELIIPFFTFIRIHCCLNRKEEVAETVQCIVFISGY